MSVQPIRSTRADDELLLEIIDLRRRCPAASVARFYGLTSARIRSMCNRVLIDDLKFSGEAEATVRAAYWSDKV